VNVPVDGNVATNDNVPVNSSYGTPIPVAGNPTGATITMASNGQLPFQCSHHTRRLPVPRAYVCTTPNRKLFFCFVTITVLNKTSISNMPVANTDIAETKAKTAVVLNSLANDAPGYVSGSLDTASVTIIMHQRMVRLRERDNRCHHLYPAHRLQRQRYPPLRVCDKHHPLRCVQQLYKSLQ
jgi:hypothetical protein